MPEGRARGMARSKGTSHELKLVESLSPIEGKTSSNFDRACSLEPREALSPGLRTLSRTGGETTNTDGTVTAFDFGFGPAADGRTWSWFQICSIRI